MLKKYMERVEEKENIFSKIKEFFNVFLNEDLAEDEKIDFENKEIEESRKKIKELEAKFFNEPKVRKLPDTHIENVKVSKETLKKMREKLNDDGKLNKVKGEVEDKIRD